MAQITGLCGESEAPVGIFVYGTLRNDSGSTAAYTAKFNEGCVSVPAILKDARMYFDSHYPFVTLGQVSPSVV